MKEVWRDVKHYEDYYEVSSLGRVRAKQTREFPVCNQYGAGYETKGDILPQWDNGRGYQKVCLRGNRKGLKRKDEYVHRLVAMAFIPNPENKPQVDHIDCCRSNNEVTNLRWVTQAENEHNELTWSKRVERNKNPEYRKKLGAHGERNGANTHPEKNCFCGPNNPSITHPERNVFVTNNPAKRLYAGTHYYNNGVIEVREKECPEGFVKGRLPGKYKKKKQENIGIRMV